MPTNPNAVTIDAAAWLDPGEWSAAADRTKDRYLRKVAERAEHYKREQLRQGRGGNGRLMVPVKPESRPDGATGKPLSPHYGASRSARNLATSIGRAAGTVKVWWRGGWGTILGYHARGEVIGAPTGEKARDVIGFTKADLARLKADALQFWRTLHRPRTPAPPSPTPAAVAAVEARLGIRFVRPARMPLVAVDVNRLDRALAEDRDYHVGPGGVGPSAKPGAYERAREFLSKARREGLAVEPPRVGLDAEGNPFIDDGRHRWAALRDEGHPVLVVAVPRSRAKVFARRFGPRAVKPVAVPRVEFVRPGRAVPAFSRNIRVFEGPPQFRG